MVIVLCAAFFVNLNGMLTEFVENGVSTNRFLSEYSGGTCPTSSGTVTGAYGEDATTSGAGLTDCGNAYIYDVIGVNFVQGVMLNAGTYYIYNDFGTYVSAMSTALNNTAPPAINNTSDSFDQSLQDAEDDLATALTSGVSTDTEEVVETTTVEDAFAAATGDSSNASTDATSYPAVGVYQIELSTSPSVQAIVLPDIQPAEGQVKLVARLRYNGGKSYSQDDTQGVYLWSQDAICLSPTDSFKIVVSSDADNTATAAALDAATSSVESDLNSYFEYDNTTIDDCPAYTNAVNSPRKIRLEIVS